MVKSVVSNKNDAKEAIAISQKTPRSSLLTTQEMEAIPAMLQEESTEEGLFVQEEFEAQNIVNWEDIKLVALDVDGVLTDGGLSFDGNGLLHQRFHVRDGFGLVSAQKMGIIIAWISGRESAVARARFNELKLNPEYCILACPDKAAALRKIQRNNNLQPHQCCFVGDDIPDLAAFSVSGVKVAVADGSPELQAQADYVTRARGGHGAVREVLEHILKAQGLWKKVLLMFSGSGGNLSQREDMQR